MHWNLSQISAGINEKKCVWGSGQKLIKEQNLNFICKVRTFVGGEDIVFGPHIFKGAFEEFRLGLEV